MSIANPLLLNQQQPRPRMVCYDAARINSDGIFIGDKPLLFSVPLLLFELIVVFLATNTVHFLLKRLGQSRFVSHVIAGILLGPSIIGRSEAFRLATFPERGFVILDVLSIFGLIFFLFNVGVKTDIQLISNLGKGVVAISLASSVLPVVLGMAVFNALRPAFPQDLQDGPFVAQVIMRLSMSSFPVVVDALDELQLLNSQLGRIAVSAALLEDIANLLISLVMATAIMVSTAETPATAVGIVASVVLMPLILVFSARPAAKWASRQATPGDMLPEWPFLALLLMALVASLMTQSFGFNLTLGPILLGLAVPGGVPVGVTVTERLQPMCTGFLLPLYLLLLGSRTDLAPLSNVKMWGALQLVVVACYVGKLGGTVAASRFFDIPVKDAVSVGLMLNVKGLVEIFIFQFFVDNKMASPDHLPALTLAMLLLTAITTPLIKMLYDPMQRYVIIKRRTIEHLPHGSELRLLACVHTENHVNPLLDILDAAHATRESPLSITVLHLNQITGRTAPVLIEHRCHNSRIQELTATDRIMNAFHHFEKQQPENGSVTLNTFVAMSPIRSMHNDVCSLALDHKTALVLLPFHKHFDGARETASQAIQSLNRNVLDFAPCSVAILVNQAQSTVAATFAYSNHLPDRVAVYFLGGPDDREALALASRMAQKHSVVLTIVRFVAMLSDEGKGMDDREERKLDDVAVERVRQQFDGNDRLSYVEKEVKDGEATALAIHRTCEHFDLVIVGRRNGMETELTSGLSEWSECPELGIIGDMLAMEFADKVSILVVQQHQNQGERGREEINGGSVGVVEDRGFPKSYSAAAASSDLKEAHVIIHH